MLEENKKLVLRYYELVEGDLAGIEEVVTADFVDHHFPPETPPGPAGVRQFFQQFIPGFSAICGSRSITCWPKATGSTAISPRCSSIRASWPASPLKGTRSGFRPSAPSGSPTANWPKPGRSTTAATCSVRSRPSRPGRAQSPIQKVYRRVRKELENVLHTLGMAP